jgi:hypothetical protein
MFLDTRVDPEANLNSHMLLLLPELEYFDNVTLVHDLSEVEVYSAYELPLRAVFVVAER